MPMFSNFRFVSVASSVASLLMAANAVAAPSTLDPVLQVQAAISEASKSMASGAKVVTFQYRPNKIYEVSIKPGMFTTFTFQRGESIRQFALANPDAAEVEVNEDTGSAMLRLDAPVTMPATIVTNKSTYYITIIPAPAGQWHQGVSWSSDSSGNGSGFGFGFRSAGEQTGSEAEDSLAGQPNFNYAIEGDKSVAPVAVWDNGRFTWIQFSDAVQSVPAVFFLGPNGAEVVNYVVQPGGKQIKVNRLMTKMMLRLGNQKSIVTAK